MARPKKLQGELKDTAAAMLAEGKTRSEVAKALNVSHFQLAREFGNVFKHRKPSETAQEAAQ